MPVACGISELWPGGVAVPGRSRGAASAPEGMGAGQAQGSGLRAPAADELLARRTMRSCRQLGSEGFASNRKNRGNGDLRGNPWVIVL